MALQDITLLTLVFEFLPPLIVTFVYLLFFGKRKSKIIEVFIGVMYLKTITWFLFNIAIHDVQVMANPQVDTTGLFWALLTDMIFKFAFSLQEFLTWIMIAFYGVLFGMVILALKLLLQDPMKMRFKNIIRRITKREPESDGFSSFRDRVNNIRFEGVEPQPLDPEVQAKAWRGAWKDYTIIGLATLIPTIAVYMGSLPTFILQVTGDPLYSPPDNYWLGVTIFLTWIYRFGYPASNRIAKGAGLYLGDRDIGSEMMRGVLGWFFRLNILLSLYFIITQIWTFLSSEIADIGTIVFQYYFFGLLYAAPPIIFVVLVLPMVEDFAVVFYKNLFEGLTQTRSKLSNLNIRESIENLFTGAGIGFIVSLGFIGAVIAATVNYTVGAFLFPRQLGNTVQYDITGATSNYALFAPVIWTLLMLAIPFVFMLMTGIVGHMARKRIGGAIETFALLSGTTVSLVTYFLLTGMDYMLAAFPSQTVYSGFIYNRMIPFPVAPAAEQWIYRLASQFIINLPMYVFTALFILYFFQFRAKWKQTTGDMEGPLLNTHKRDIIDSVLMFFGGLAVSLLGVWLVTMLLSNTGYVLGSLEQLLRMIGDPDGLEAILIPNPLNPGGLFILLAEHNIIRTFLMLIIGPVFWSAVLWFVAVEKKGNEKLVGTWSVVLLVLCAAITYVWTQFDAINGVFNPYDPILGFAANLGYRAIIVFGIPVVFIVLAAIVNSVRGKGIGISWFPLVLMLFAIEYFVYDDQFTLIALIIVPIFLAGAYRLLFGGRLSIRAMDGKREDFLITYIKFSLMSLAIAEVLSTALTVGGIAIIRLTAPPPFGGNIVLYLSSLLPHAIIEIPVFLVAAAAAIRIAKDLWPTIEAEDWASIPSKTKSLLSDGRTWRTFALIVFLLVIAALVEAYVTHHIMGMV